MRPPSDYVLVYAPSHALRLREGDPFAIVRPKPVRRVATGGSGDVDIGAAPMRAPAWENVCCAGSSVRLAIASVAWMPEAGIEGGRSCTLNLL